MKKTCLRIALLFPSISMAGQGVFLDVNNFTNDSAALNAVQVYYWKHGDLGSEVLGPCSSKRYYTEAEGYGNGQWYRGSIDLGYGEDQMKGGFALAHGKYDVPKEFFTWQASGSNRDRSDTQKDYVFIQPNIGRDVDAGAYNNGIAAHYVMNDGPDQDLINITILPKSGSTECAINERMAEFMFIDRLPRAVSNHKKDFVITSGPTHSIKTALEKGLFADGWTFATTRPTLDLKIEPAFSSSNDVNTSIESVSDGQFYDNNSNTGISGKFCNYSDDPQTFLTLGYDNIFKETTTTRVKHGWGVDVQFKSTLEKSIVVGKATFEKSIVFKYSGESEKTDLYENSIAIKAPSMSVVVNPKKCKQVSYTVSHSKIKTDLLVDYQVNDVRDIYQNIYAGDGDYKHRLFTIKTKLSSLLKYPEDGFSPPQVVVEKRADAKGRPADIVFIRGKADLESTTGYTVKASVMDVNP